MSEQCIGRMPLSMLFVCAAKSDFCIAFFVDRNAGAVPSELGSLQHCHARSHFNSDNLLGPVSQL